MFFGGGWHLCVCVWTSHARHELGVPHTQPLLMGLSSCLWVLPFYFFPPLLHTAFNLQLVFIK